MKNIKQFDIYQADFSPQLGSEQSGIRPCVILQTNAISKVARTVLVAPFSSKKLDRIYPFQVLANKSKKNGLKKDSKIKLDQLRIIDRQRFIKKLGSLELDYQPAISQAIDVMIDRFGDFKNE